MTPASSPVNEPKLNPAATMEDQDKEPARIELGPPAFSSNRPHTDAIKSLAEVDRNEAGEANIPATHEEAAARASQSRSAVTDEEMKATDWVDQIKAAQTPEQLSEIETRYLDADKDYSTVNDAFEKKQAEFKEVENAAKKSASEKK
jgi:hypothetical protein